MYELHNQTQLVSQVLPNPLFDEYGECQTKNRKYNVQNSPKNTERYTTKAYRLTAIINFQELTMLNVRRFVWLPVNWLWTVLKKKY